jgi:hypothetical protein
VILASKFAKSTNMSQFFFKFNRHVKQNLMLNPLKKYEKNFTEKLKCNLKNPLNGEGRRVLWGFRTRRRTRIKEFKGSGSPGVMTSKGAKEQSQKL